MSSISNRRSFLRDIITGSASLIVAPQIVTHGLKLVRPRQQSVINTLYYEQFAYYESRGIIWQQIDPAHERLINAHWVEEITWDPKPFETILVQPPSSVTNPC